MFPNTLTVNIADDAHELVRVNQDGYSSEYRKTGAGELITLKLRNSNVNDRLKGIKAYRHNVELIQTVYPTEVGKDPIVRKVYFVFEHNPSDTIIDPVSVAQGLTGLLSETNLVKLANFES